MGRLRLSLVFTALCAALPVIDASAINILRGEHHHHHHAGSSVEKRQNSLSPPAKLPEGWAYNECYNDTGAARTLTSINSQGDNMSAAQCIAYCDTMGYAYAGTEYSRECYCGIKIANYGAPAADGCNMECTGAPGEICGGPNRLSMYHKVNASVPVDVPPKGWTALGCYNDNAGSRILSHGIGVPQNNASSCATACAMEGYKYAGTEYSSECYCGDTLDNGHGPSDSGCDMFCNGNRTQICGGANHINIYEFGVSSTTSSTAASTASSSAAASSDPASSAAPSSAAPSSAAPSSAAPSSAAPSSAAPSSAPTSSAAPTPSPVLGWVAQGCYVDNNGGRALGAGAAVQGGMTNAKCQAACKAAGYTLAGTEYGGECWCDNQIRFNNGPATDGNDGCNMNCNGNQTEICGGPNRLTMFQYQSGNNPSTTAPNGVSSTSASSTTAAAIATGLPAGFAYKGCYVDGPGFRIMNFQQTDDQQMTIASCSQNCASLGYTIAGMEYTFQCFCDDVIRQNGSLASDDAQCNSNCGGDATQKCGGPNRLSVWSSQDQVKVDKIPVPKPKVDQWEYQGCITDNQQGQRVLPYQLVNSTGNTPEWCLAECKKFGYLAGGLEYGEECYCGDVEGVNATGSVARPESECGTPCSGDSESICGGGLRLSWYKWTGAPLYQWSYPQGNAAGRYEFLVGGPIVPLVVQPSINGKVSFLEKHGTGNPNSTGAFEFDPSLGSDITRAWRQQNGLRTDVFCSASLTLPDKSGRLINVGGWSLDSTFGIRLYTPDGSPGNPSYNDWQENVDALKLQTGRWYPSAMVMANGSILVVGGQQGSNAAPEPSMEILPRAGGLVVQEFLRESDPYNLYPYLAVMPSGKIFIGYWNKARLLDENSLQTVSVLPQIPGAVNDGTAGRTYPFEGTQVLLPQYYPYTDPLEVLICGGASRAPMWGLDNCVSIAPDAPNPQWTIERMPSRRVLSCMATLPDGTFLILNGGELGEAGFGLAKSPNLNALLYDSRKPKNQRFSVMANTTIARMYHSEAVLLDDGRVLVSGSDPQDADFPEEYRVEQFLPPYLLDGRTQPQLTVPVTDWSWEGTYSFQITRPNGNGDIQVSLLGSEASTHGNSMGARILFPQISCAGNSCTVTAPKGPYIAPAGWYRMYVMEGPTPSHATWVRIGGDPASLGNWPNYPDFQPLPGV